MLLRFLRLPEYSFHYLQADRLNCPVLQLHIRQSRLVNSAVFRCLHHIRREDCSYFRLNMMYRINRMDDPYRLQQIRKLDLPEKVYYLKKFRLIRFLFLVIYEHHLHQALHYGFCLLHHRRQNRFRRHHQYFHHLVRMHHSICRRRRRRRDRHDFRLHLKI